MPRTKFFSLLLLAAAIFISSPTESQAAVPNQSLIKGKTDAALYYVEGGKRYAFPTEKVFFSWYADFTSVVTVADTELASYSLAGNVTYRPGNKLVKIATDSKVYAVSQYGVLRWLKTENIAKKLYGDDWNKKIDDVADTFFTNYLVGSDVGVAGDYNLNEASGITDIGTNIRPIGYTPPILTVTPSPTGKTPFVSVVLSTSQATLNQFVQVMATVSDNAYPIKKIEMYVSQNSSPLAVCAESLNCSFTYTVTQAPLDARFRAVAYDSQNTKVDTPYAQQGALTVPASSSDIILSLTPYTLTAGSKVSYSSDATKFSSITSHKVYAAIPGEPNPVLWKDCGTDALCASSSPFYRTTQLYSRVTVGGQSYQSASVALSVTNGQPPKPKLTLVKQSSSQATLKLDAPSGETIGWSSIVEGKDPDNSAVALCEYSSCEVTVQVSKETEFTAFTNVGGKLEGSETLTVKL